VTLKTRPFGRRDFTPRPGPFARRGPGPLSVRRGSVACGGAHSAVLGRLLCKNRLRFFPLNTASVVRRMVSPQLQHRGCSRRVWHLPKVWEPPHVTHRCAYPQLRYVCPKRWQRLHFSGHFGAMYDSTDTSKMQTSVSDHTFDTSGPRVTDTMKWGVGGRSLVGSWSRRTDRSCMAPAYECSEIGALPGRRSQA
jgi:hypothetical protein